MKICTICKIEKTDSEFHKRKLSKDGLASACKNCRNKKISFKKLSKDRMKVDRNFLLSIKRSILKKKHNKWEKFVDFNYKDLIKHLEGQFENGINWENYEKLWCIDFIIPRSTYLYKNFLGNEFRKCWNLKNLRPLIINEALKKTKIIDFNLVNKYNLYDILPSGINFGKNILTIK